MNYGYDRVRGCFRAPKRLCFPTLTNDCLSHTQPPYILRPTFRSRLPSSVHNGRSVRNEGWSKSFSSLLLSWGLAVAHVTVLQAPCRGARKEEKGEGKRGGRGASMKAYRSGDSESQAM